VVEVKKDGELYIFADPNQCLFNTDIENIKKLQISKQKLTRNLRNTEEVNRWMTLQMSSVHLKSTLKRVLSLFHAAMLLR
jgi:hypothetical protein